MKEESAKNLTPELLRSVLGSAEGRQLLALLSKDGPALRQAAAAYQSGDVQAAQALLKPLVEKPEAAELLQKINKK